MSGGEVFVQDLATVLGVAGLTAVVARAMGQSAIVGYLAAGFIVGPYIPLPVFADPERVRALASFGVVLVMFAVGLEFSFGRLARLLPRAGLPALFQMGSLAFLGSALGRLIGFTPVEHKNTTALVHSPAMFLPSAIAVVGQLFHFGILEVPFTDSEHGEEHAGFRFLLNQLHQCVVAGTHPPTTLSALPTRSTRPCVPARRCNGSPSRRSR